MLKIQKERRDEKNHPASKNPAPVVEKERRERRRKRRRRRRTQQKQYNLSQWFPKKKGKTTNKCENKENTQGRHNRNTRGAKGEVHTGKTWEQREAMGTPMGNTCEPTGETEGTTGNRREKPRDNRVTAKGNHRRESSIK